MTKLMIMLLLIFTATVTCAKDKYDVFYESVQYYFDQFVEKEIYSKNYAQMATDQKWKATIDNHVDQLENCFNDKLSAIPDLEFESMVDLHQKAPEITKNKIDTMLINCKSKTMAARLKKLMDKNRKNNR